MSNQKDMRLETLESLDADRYDIFKPTSSTKSQN